MNQKENNSREQQEILNQLSSNEDKLPSYYQTVYQTHDPNQQHVIIQPIVIQPEQIGVYQTRPSVESNWSYNMVWSLFNILFCCFPIGLPAFVFSLMSYCKTTKGNLTEAERNASVSYKLNVLATSFGFVLFIVGVIRFMLVMSFS
jgi:hypothetical protein